MTRTEARFVLDDARAGADVSRRLITAALRASGDLDCTFTSHRTAAPRCDDLPSQRPALHGLAALPRTFARVEMEAA